MRHTDRNSHEGLLRTQAGFTIVESLVAMAVMGVVMAIAIIQMQPHLQEMRANNAMHVVSVQLRLARQSAIAQRRNFLVQFLGNNEVRLIRQERPAGQTVISDQLLGHGITFKLTPGLPDTPDSFGNAAPIVFGGTAGGPPIMMFQSDGAFIDANGNPINGTVFLGMPNDTSPCARAVTVLGATGRVRTFRSTGTGWIK